MGKTVCEKHRAAYEIETGCPDCEPAALTAEERAHLNALMDQNRSRALEKHFRDGAVEKWKDVLFRANANGDVFPESGMRERLREGIDFARRATCNWRPVSALDRGKVEKLKDEFFKAYPEMKRILDELKDRGILLDQEFVEKLRFPKLRLEADEAKGIKLSELYVPAWMRPK